MKKIESILNKFPTKLALYKIKKIIIEEMKKDYYQNLTNIKEVVDIDSHLNMDSSDNGYIHIENLVIWHNGFYNFNCFNFTTPSMKRKKDNIFKKIDERKKRCSNTPVSTRELSNTEEHKKLVKKANCEIECGRSQYASAVSNASKEIGC